MGFGDLKTQSGLQALNNFLQDKSYIDGYVPSQADTVVFESMSGCPDSSLPHALRWYNHISSYGSERTSFPGDQQKAKNQHLGNAVTNGNSKPADDDDDDDDEDLFGSDSESEDEESKKIKQERLDAYYAKKATKKAVIAKSMITLDVKPWDDETDMKEMEKLVRTVECDGLVWGASKLIPLAYGIKKLQIACVVEDDKCGSEYLSEKIGEFEDLVQSVDVASFNKL
ncbi:elongation factor 1-beta [Exaiptasia diaphana]|uniref:Elongation factor 1-beta n=1 Tax=Exaiptasia diaphana TaxID=2652724 RepID=A0A913X6E9_EXADI|nr:elongation factor 1-beta [Exaiptasia diaphana]KXJ14823.1 Elongation factor 1-beta [Exaiptasia diaphana]